jgi:Asp-tRNA(Asn)/Glu-tRNA(Gln) amidotransferase A subunit family amidase
MSTHGVHAGCVEDMWATAIAIATRAGGDPGRAPLQGPAETPAAHRPFALGIMQTEGWAALDDNTREAFAEVVSHLAATGVEIRRRENDPAIERFEQAIVGVRQLANSITAWENHWAMRNLVAQTPDGVSARAKTVITIAEELGVQGYADLLRRRELVRDVHAPLASSVDALLAPASPGPAPLWSGDAPGQPLAQRPTGDAVFNTPSSLLGAPVVTVPLMAVNNMPVGLQVMGQPGMDARVTAIARWLAATLPFVHR